MMPWRKLLLLCLCLHLGCLQAQSSTAPPAGLTPDEVAQFRAVLAEPVPDNVLTSTLEKHFNAKEAAAYRLSDAAAMETVSRQAIDKFPRASRYRNNLGVALDLQGRYDEAIEAWRVVVQNEKALKALVAAAMSDIAETLIKLGRLDEATEWLKKAKETILGIDIQTAFGSSQQQRYLANNLRYQSQIEYARGRFDQAVQLANSSIPFADRSIEYAQRLDAEARGFRLGSAINTYKSRFQILKNAGKFNEAESAARELIQLSRSNAAPARLLPEFYSSLADLESAKRDFRQAETYARKALEVWVGLGYPAQHANRIEASGDLLLTLVYGGRLEDAVSLLRGLDEMARTDDTLQKAVRFVYARGLLHLKRGEFSAAIEFLRLHLAASEQQYGASSYYAAQASGLLGVALWKHGEAQSKAEAAPLLDRAVHGYMAAENAEFVLDIYERYAQRQWIFSAYLDAVSQQNDRSGAAMMAADWVRSSAVQEALADAATRAAATTPAIADLVRDDTDARNEVRALTSLLLSKPNLNVALAEVDAKMRARIVELGAKRAALHARIKSQFAEYDQLVRPGPLVLSDVARQLQPSQALLMLLPTEHAVYVWSLTDAGRPQFHRADLSHGRVADLVYRIRKTLDFDAMNGRLAPYDATAAYDLYQALLKPLEKSFDGKTELIISAGGLLAQIPFGVLLAQPTGGGHGEAAWLIQRYAISHIPSVSSLLAVGRLVRNKPAAEALLGWGDPVFDPQARQLAGAAPTRNVVLTRTSTAVDLEHGGAQPTMTYGQMPRLPETRDELLSIARVLHADPATDLRLGDQATRQSVLMASESGLLAHKRVVAFATHGLMAFDFPGLDEPALALAAVAANSQSPIANLLTLKDVMGLRLHADWVVLSACNTAAADGKAEEALSGLARGFFYAGSRSVLVTHWAVESESAKQLMAGTFEHYATNTLAPKSESLRQAMLKVMAQPGFSHPAYWGPYALVGDGGR